MRERERDCSLPKQRRSHYAVREEGGDGSQHPSRRRRRRRRREKKTEGKTEGGETGEARPSLIIFLPLSKGRGEETRRGRRETLRQSALKSLPPPPLSSSKSASFGFPTGGKQKKKTCIAYYNVRTNSSTYILQWTPKRSLQVLSLSLFRVKCD